MDNNDIYYFDRLHILVNLHKSHLAEILPLGELSNEARHFALQNVTTVAKQFGFLSRIVVVAPRQRFLELLALHWLHLEGSKINYLEVANDFQMSTKNKTLQAFKLIREHLFKKYSHQHCLYNSDKYLYDDSEETANLAKREDDETRYSSQTGYWGSERHQFVLYPRLSKISNTPCIHGEWRIKGACYIRRITGISSVLDLPDFNIQGFMDRQRARFFDLRAIDHDKHGRWLGDKCNAVVSQAFCRYHEIHSAAELIEFYKSWQERLKKSPEPKTEKERKILSLKSSQLRSFLKPWRP